MSGVKSLLDGFQTFRGIYYGEESTLFRERLNLGQSPRYAMVACADSRVSPSIVLQTGPGEIFTVRNIAALVPPQEETIGRYHGVSAALEFAVKILRVEHLIIMGHAHCGGIAAMARKREGGKAGGRFIAAWTSLMNEARDRALAQKPGLEGDALLRACERQGVLLSLDNLMTFEIVQRATRAGELTVHGWYLDIFAGTLEAWNPDRSRFERVG